MNSAKLYRLLDDAIAEAMKVADGDLPAPDEIDKAVRRLAGVRQPDPTEQKDSFSAN